MRFVRKKGASFRGQPVLMLGLLLGGWGTARLILWGAPFAAAVSAAEVEYRAAAVSDQQISAVVRPGSVEAHLTASQDGDFGVRHRIMPGPRQADPAFLALAPAYRTDIAALPAPLLPTPALPASPLFVSLAAEQPAPPQAAPFPPTSPAGRPGQQGRWSSDAWFLLRHDTAPAAASGAGSYGRSQFGGVLRYRLASQSSFRPAVYLRGSQSIDHPQDTELAAGFSARPAPSIPVSMAAELRVTQTAGRTLLRPAVYAVTELPPVDLAMGFTGEAYLQAGYVGGEYATAFVDGQVRAERGLARAGDFELRAGGGAWGGAQDGAERLDIGPAATLALPLGRARGRVPVDWRFRVAGEAEPADGPALTISAGF